MTRRRGAPAASAAALGVSFRAPELLSEALTHRSVGGAASNERLEFLGDRVLGLVVAERLMAARRDEDEGALARRFAALVSAPALAGVAARIGLGDRLEMSASEAANGGREKAGNLANACEALIGALYLDGGLPAAAAFIDRHWNGLMAAQTEPPIDPKTALQEWTQARGMGLPAYRVAAVEGPDHKPTFSVAVALADGRGAQARGAGKRAAEQAAAARLLARLGGGDAGE